jgi:hypothetical protein
MHFAAMAGLPTGGFRASADPREDAGRMLPPTHAAIVFDGRTYGTLLPRALFDGCRRFATLAGASLMQIEFNRSPEHGFRFVNASSAVEFRLGGRLLARDLARAFARSMAA